MRYPNAIWLPGPTWKVNGAPLTPRGVVAHSAVGFRSGLLSVLHGSERASWHFSILFDGTVWQHYERQQCWHAQAANSFTFGIEHEGGFDPEDEPLTEAQLAASVALVRWLGKTYGFPLVRDPLVGRTLFEHNEFHPKPCPSGRIQWERYTELETEDDMTEDERELLRLTAKTFVLDAVELSFYTEDEQTALMLDRLRRYHAAVPTSLSGRLSNIEARLDA